MMKTNATAAANGSEGPLPALSPAGFRLLGRFHEGPLRLALIRLD